MRSHNNMLKPALTKAAGGILTLMLVGACSSSSGPTVKQEAGTRRASNAVEAALCEGRASDAQEILLAEPLASPTDRFYTALALEKSGLAISARKIYAGLMQSGAQDGVFLRCGSEILANGTVTAESGRRLAALAQQLQAMDVAPEKPKKLHTGLPVRVSTQPTGATATSSNFNSAPMAIYRPNSTSPLGRWFAHLESYKTYKNALENKPVLEGKFPPLKGYIDQWQVDAAGGVVRLGVRLDSRDDARRLCQQVKSNGSYCAVLDTSG
ncbi:MAG: hypothetical protein HWE25_11230 [Alphaproteobacteria bacterium]|nr:hypothetical protein [Alphaproteobacteria bacterium]